MCDRCVRGPRSSRCAKQGTQAEIATEVLSTTHVPAARGKVRSASCKEIECTAVFLRFAIPLVHEVPAVPYIGANATSSHTGKYEKKTKDDRAIVSMSTNSVAFGSKPTTPMVVVQ